MVKVVRQGGEHWVKDVPRTLNPASTWGNDRGGGGSGGVLFVVVLGGILVVSGCCRLGRVRGSHARRGALDSVTF